MKKKILLLINLILLIAFCGYLILEVKNDSHISCEYLSQKEYEKVCARLENTSDDILEELTFNGYSLPCNRSEGIFYLPLSMSDDNWENGILSTNDKDVDVVFLDNLMSVEKSEAIANNVEYRLLAVKENYYREYKLVFTGLPIMEISINGANEGTEEYDVDMKLYDSSTKIDWIKSSNATIGVRGNTSRLYPKQAYKMELYNYNSSGVKKNNKLSLLGMREDNDWILYAMYNDETKVRDKLSIDIWNEYGATNNPYNGEYGVKMEYVEVIMNGEYMGLYGLMEPIDAKKLNITAQSSTGTAEYIYKRTTPVVLDLAEFTQLSSITQCGFELKGLSKYGAISGETWAPLIDYVEFETTESDEEYKAKALEMLDVDNVMDVWLYLQIVTGFDNRGKNMYYVSKASEDSRKMYFVPWDMDLTWGNVSKENPPLYTAFEGDNLIKELVDWQPGDRVLALNVDNSQEKVRNRWLQLREEYLADDNLIAMVENLEDIVINSGAMMRDERRWPEAGHTYDYTQLKEYAVDRMAFLDEYFENQ